MAQRHWRRATTRLLPAGGPLRANVAKSPDAGGELRKFGREALDDPCNLFWVPTYKHDLITGYYNSRDDGDPSRTRRQVVDNLDFVGQFAVGLEAMRKYGVLK